MQGHTHALFGVTTLAIANHLAGFIQPHLIRGVPTGMVVCAGAALLGALLPDIDAEESTIKSELGLAGRMLGGGLSLFGVRHRGLTHRGIVALLVLAVGVVMGDLWGWPDAGWAFGLGWVSHVLADGLTVAGVPLLWPWKKKDFHLLPKPLRVRTGGPVEGLIFVMIVSGLFLGVILTGNPIVDWPRYLLALFK